MDNIVDIAKCTINDIYDIALHEVHAREILTKHHLRLSKVSYRCKDMNALIKRYKTSDEGRAYQPRSSRNQERSSSQFISERERCFEVIDVSC